MSTLSSTSAEPRARPRVPDAALPWLGVLGVLVLIELRGARRG